MLHHSTSEPHGENAAKGDIINIMTYGGNLKLSHAYMMIFTGHGRVRALYH